MPKIETVNKGDIIVERVGGKNRMIPVRKVEHNTCSKRSVHINSNACYDWGTDVRLVQGEGTLGDLEKEFAELGTVRVDEEGVNEEDMDAVMDHIMSIADRLVKH